VRQYGEQFQALSANKRDGRRNRRGCYDPTLDPARAAVPVRASDAGPEVHVLHRARRTVSPRDQALGGAKTGSA
jgi:hypothetical protein